MKIFTTLVIHLFFVLGIDAFQYDGEIKFKALYEGKTYSFEINERYLKYVDCVMNLNIISKKCNQFAFEHLVASFDNLISSTPKIKLNSVKYEIVQNFMEIKWGNESFFIARNSEMAERIVGFSSEVYSFSIVGEKLCTK